MEYLISITEAAKRDLTRIGGKEAGRIITKLRSIEQMSDPMRSAKALRGKFDGYYRFRIGVYRAIFTKNKEGKIIILHILKIDHRKNIYR